MKPKVGLSISYHLQSSFVVLRCIAIPLVTRTDPSYSQAWVEYNHLSNSESTIFSLRDNLSIHGEALCRLILQDLLQAHACALVLAHVYVLSHPAWWLISPSDSHSQEIATTGSQGELPAWDSIKRGPCAPSPLHCANWQLPRAWV